MSIMKKDKKEDAVSPVVGVMLMLVVTIIIAAVVAAFASGVATDTEAASNVIIKLDDYTMGTVNQSVYDSSFSSTYVDGWYDYGDSPYGGSNSNYAVYEMVFMHKGGERLLTEDLILTITYNGASYRTPFSAVVQGEASSLSVGEKIVLSARGDHLATYKYGLSQQSMMKDNSFDWSIIDGSGYVISKGTTTFSQPWK